MVSYYVLNIIYNVYIYIHFLSNAYDLGFKGLTCTNTTRLGQRSIRPDMFKNIKYFSDGGDEFENEFMC